MSQKNYDRFFKWLKKQNYYIINASVFNEIAGIFGKTFRLDSIDKIVKPLFEKPFVIKVDNWIPIGCYGSVKEYASQLKAEGLSLVLVVQSINSSLKDAFGDNVLCLDLSEVYTKVVVHHSYGKEIKYLFDEKVREFLRGKETV
jgi:hypothetical protein